ncbi:BatD family protein [Flavobacterium caeni]|uniref:Oxygen tolerance n=1 Tax=Flavobacterium caeni TaxID=490189 RepID=A0A1G5GZ92_9FLAO|nr:BatD family protein [Flavobacterium caeni]SCY56450.1 Oxygen tolerance [Flavobacterium caeni]
MKRLLLLLLLCAQGLVAQVQFEAKVSKTTLGLNERLRVDFTMNGDGDNFTPPSFEGFRVVGGPSQQVSQSWVNGRSSFQKAYSYFLLPLQKGTLVLRQATVEINGQVYKTNPIKITVTNAVDLPKDPYNAPQVSANDAIHLVAEVSKANPYVNEPITVVYKLYFGNIVIKNQRSLNNPKYNDFWSQNIEIKQIVTEEGVYNGQRCNVAVLKKVVLYPQKSGKLEIEPLSIDFDLQLPTNRRDFFGRPYLVDDNKRVTAGAKTINVKPLPENGKPADFSGAVGKFNFKVTPSKTNLKNGESLDLKVAVSGTGNLKLFDIPKPVVPNSLEMYDPVHKENVSTPLSGMNGEISDTYTIITQFKGKYPIKPMSFSYFDLGSNSYKTITSPEIMVNVLDGPGAPEANDVAANTGVSKVKVSANEQFHFIALKTGLVSAKRKDFLGSGLFYTLLFAPLLIIPIVVVLRKKKEAIDGDVVGNRIRQSNKLAKKYLSEAKKQTGNKELFYIALEKSLHNFLKAKLHIETSEMSKDRIREILSDKNAQSQTINDFIQLTESCEFARYAPSSSVSIQQDYEKAVSIISELEKQLSS